MASDDNKLIYSAYCLDKKYIFLKFVLTRFTGSPFYESDFRSDARLFGLYGGFRIPHSHILSGLDLCLCNGTK